MYVYINCCLLGNRSNSGVKQGHLLFRKSEFRLITSPSLNIKIGNFYPLLIFYVERKFSCVGTYDGKGERKTRKIEIKQNLFVFIKLGLVFK